MYKVFTSFFTLVSEALPSGIFPSRSSLCVTFSSAPLLSRISSSVVSVFPMAADLPGPFGSSATLERFGWFVFVVLLVTGFLAPPAGATAALLVALDLGAGGIHSSLSSSLLIIWIQDLVWKTRQLSLQLVQNWSMFT